MIISCYIVIMKKNLGTFMYCLHTYEKLKLGEWGMDMEGCCNERGEKKEKGVAKSKSFGTCVK